MPEFYDRESFTCPRCGATSHHPMDVHEGYCAACNDWTDPPQFGPFSFHPMNYDRAGHPIPLRLWAELHNDDAYKVVRQDPIIHDVDSAEMWWLSTVWVGLDMAFLSGPPLIFETMLFGPADDYEGETQWRWHSEAQAIAGHDQLLMEVRARVG